MYISAEEVTGLHNTYARAQTQARHQLHHLLAERKEGGIEMRTSFGRLASHGYEGGHYQAEGGKAHQSVSLKRVELCEASPVLGG